MPPSTDHSLELPTWPDLVGIARRLSAAIPTIQLPRHHLHILKIRPYQMPRGWTVNEHEHSVYEANIILAGSARDAFADRQALGPGSVFFHGPHVPHAWGAPDAECLRLIITFTVTPSVRVRRPAAWPHWPEVLKDTATMLQIADAAAPGWTDRAAARLAAILADVLTLGELPDEVVEPPREGDDLEAMVNSFLADNLRHRLRLDDVAGHASISVSSLTHRYLEITGQSVGKHLMALRLEEAARLLSTTDLPLKVISHDVGLGDPAYLCRLFKRYFRVTPTQYRRHHAGTNQ